MKLHKNLPAKVVEAAKKFEAKHPGAIDEIDDESDQPNFDPEKTARFWVYTNPGWRNMHSLCHTGACWDVAEAVAVIKSIEACPGCETCVDLRAEDAEESA
jgi:hypothetical protein